MMTPSQWTITCSAWDCSSEHGRPLSKPLVIDTTDRADAVRQARLRGWVPTQLLHSGKAGTDTWWCPAHVQQTRQAVAEVADESRRKQLLAWYDRADRLRTKAQAS